LNKTQNRLRGDVQKLKEDYNKLADEKDDILNIKNEEIDQLKQEKDQLEEIIESLDVKLDEIAKQNELRDQLLEESIDKGKELEDLLHIKEQEIHSLVQDFEEQQSEKENQIHHLKSTATNTIRNLYALNGLTGENISNNIDAQQMKRSMSGKTLDFSKDGKKRVTFDTKDKLRSFTRGPGDKGEMNETINLSKTQKLVSPHRKRTAAYTQATRSSLRDSRGAGDRDMGVSLTSMKGDGETMVSPLRATTPAKTTQGRKSRLDRSYDEETYRDENTHDPNMSMYGIPRTIENIDSNSALVEHLKSLLKNALDREESLTGYIENLCNNELPGLSTKFENLKKADMKMREDCERLQMRNEELEIRLLDSQGKLWNLKQLYNEAENLIRGLLSQKQDNSKISEDFKTELMSAIDFFLMEIEALRKKIGEHLLPTTDDSINQVFDEAIKKINQLNNQLIDINGVNDSNLSVIESLKNELSELHKINERLENQLYKYQYDLNRVTDVLMNDAFPSDEELLQEEQDVEEMSDQEQHLFLLLKRISSLRTKEKEMGDKLEVYSKDIDELMDKNKHLADAEELKNELILVIESEKGRVIELEGMLDEKSHSFHMIVEEKEGLLITINELQIEKDELKHTLDTLHQLRDQEEEEIEKTLDEAKSIIQKLEEKLHNKDDKIRKYKERLELTEKDKSEISKQRSDLEEEFRDKEKNMKLKLLWAQMEKKDLATTILKLENSSHNIAQSEHKSRHLDPDYDQTMIEKERNSFSEDCKGENQEMTYNDDTKRYSEAYYRRESMDRARSGSQNRASLRRRHVDGERHDRTRSAISLESKNVTKTEFSLHNQGGNESSMDIR
jgi:chromosome segregation ATPase